MAQRRILILTNRIPYPLNDGGNLAMNAMIEGYHEAGWEVYLLAMNTKRHFISQQKIKKLYNNIAGFKTVEVDNRVRPLATLKNYFREKEPSHAKRFKSEAYSKELQEVLKHFNPDVVQLESVFLTSYLTDIKTHSSAVTVLRLHNVERQIWERLADMQRVGLKRRYIRDLARRIKEYEHVAWPLYDLLLPITDTDADMVSATHRELNMHIAPFGLNLQPEKNEEHGEEWWGYHIGAMDWLPNQEALKWFMRKVWPVVVKQSPAFRFYYAGRNMPNEFKRMEYEHAICSGEVADAHKFISDKKILIVPLRSGGGIRIKVLEAMTEGKVVISTDIGMQGIEAVPGKHYLKANTPEEFSDAIAWCLANKPTAIEMGNEAKKLVRGKYDRKRIMNGVIDKLNYLLSQKRSADK